MSFGSVEIFGGSPGDCLRCSQYVSLDVQFLCERLSFVNRIVTARSCFSVPGIYLFQLKAVCRIYYCWWNLTRLLDVSVCFNLVTTVLYASVSSLFLEE